MNHKIHHHKLKGELQIVEVIHIASNIISGGFLGVVCIGIYLILNKDISTEAKEVCYDIVNFNLSFIIYFIIGFLALFILIGFVLLPITYGLWLVLMILGAIKHLGGERYHYPLIIKFLT